MKAIVLLLLLAACVKQGRYGNALPEHVLTCREQAKDVYYLDNKPHVMINNKWYNDCMEAMGYVDFDPL